MIRCPYESPNTVHAHLASMQEKAVGDAKGVHRFSLQSPVDQFNMKAKSNFRDKYSIEREAENKSFINKKNNRRDEKA